MFIWFQVGGDGEMDDKILLFWPTTIVHRITPESPLYNLTPADLNECNTSFEIIVVLEGIVESTGLTTQARSSYLPSEVRTQFFDHFGMQFLFIEIFRFCGAIASSAWLRPSRPRGSGSLTILSSTPQSPATPASSPSPLIDSLFAVLR